MHASVGSTFRSGRGTPPDKRTRWQPSIGAVSRSRDADVDGLARFMRGVYGWMGGGLLLTAVTAALVASSPSPTAAIFGNRVMFWVLAIAQLGIVFTLSASVDRLASGTAATLFIVYSALSGRTLSAILLVIAFVGVIVFAGLTVSDANRLRQMAFARGASPASGATIVGALALNLDVINLFLMLLWFLGNRRDDW